MPELPEVEVVKRSLEKNILNLTIKKVIINEKKLRYIVKEKEFYKTYSKKITSVKRVSKYILLNLEKNLTIMTHLGMTGKFFILDNNKKKKTSFYYELNNKDQKHNHIIFILNKKKKLIYNDIRKFGFMKIVSTDQINKIKNLASLGPEPFSKNFNVKYFLKYVQNKKIKIKDLLMNQKFVSGLGNIYVNEVLFLSKTNPKKIVSKIKKEEIARIINKTRKILKKSIEDGGSSIQNFNDSNGKSGLFQQKFKVYGREGKKCNKISCNEYIQKIIISNRSSFYCKSCQK